MIRSLTIRANRPSPGANLSRNRSTLSFFSVRRFSINGRSKNQNCAGFGQSTSTWSQMVISSRVPGWAVFLFVDTRWTPGVQDLGSQYLSHQRTSERAQFLCPSPPESDAGIHTVCLSRGVAYFGKLFATELFVYSTPSFMRRSQRIARPSKSKTFFAVRAPLIEL